MCRRLLGKAYEDIEDQGPYLDVEGKKYREVAPSTGRVMTVFGVVEFPGRVIVRRAGQAKALSQKK